MVLTLFIKEKDERVTVETVAPCDEAPHVVIWDGRPFILTDSSTNPPTYLEPGWSLVKPAKS